MKSDFSPRAVEVWANLVPALLTAVERQQTASAIVEKSYYVPNQYVTIAIIALSLIALLIFVCIALVVYICVKRNRNKGTVFITADQQPPVMEQEADGSVQTLFGWRYR